MNFPVNPGLILENLCSVLTGLKNTSEIAWRRNATLLKHSCSALTWIWTWGTSVLVEGRCASLMPSSQTWRTSNFIMFPSSWRPSKTMVTLGTNGSSEGRFAWSSSIAVSSKRWRCPHTTQMLSTGRLVLISMLYCARMGRWSPFKTQVKSFNPSYSSRNEANQTYFFFLTCCLSWPVIPAAKKIFSDD